MARVPFKPKPKAKEEEIHVVRKETFRYPTRPKSVVDENAKVWRVGKDGKAEYNPEFPNTSKIVEESNSILDNQGPLSPKQKIMLEETLLPYARRTISHAMNAAVASVAIGVVKPEETKLTAQFSNKVDVNGKPYVRVSVIERDVATGRFLKTNTTNLRPSDAMRLRDDYLAGNKPAEGVRGIINAYQHRAAKGLVKSGFNKMKQIVTEQHRLTDLQEAQFNELVSMMSEDDFEIFYARYKNTVDEVFYSSDTRMDSDAQIAANDKKVRGRLSYDEKEAISEALIKDLADYNNISIEALNLKIAGQTQKTLIEYTR